MNLQSWATSNIGLIRKNNQDAIGCSPDSRLLVVADGMGGRAAGEVASRMAVEIVQESMQGSPVNSLSVGAADGEFQDDPLGRLRVAVESANRRIFEAGQGQAESGDSMGTTIVALLLDPANAWAHWAHVGDSRLYLLRGGELTLLTADHTVLGEAFQNSAHIPADLPHTNRLTRALGISRKVEVSTGSGSIRCGDLLLLCSDGVSGMVEPATLMSDLTGNGTLEAAGSALIQHALDAGGKDNASAVLVRVGDFG